MMMAIIKIGAEQHLKNISSGLLELEKKPERKKQGNIIETIYRETHSLKGAARSVNLAGIEDICRCLENIFAAWKSREQTPSPEQFDLLHHATDTIRKFLSPPEKEPGAISELLQQLNRLAAGRKRRRLALHP